MAIAPCSAKDGPRAKVKFRNLALLADLWENLPKGDRKLTTTENLNRSTMDEKCRQIPPNNRSYNSRKKGEQENRIEHNFFPVPSFYPLSFAL
jgi:hypothetical protein